MVFDPKLYPSDWKAISKRLRFERAEGRCECVGECSIKHVNTRCDARNKGFKVWDKTTGKYRLYETEEQLVNFLQMFDENDYKVTKIVLTVAHLCSCKPKCGNEEHLKALCNACHLMYDLDAHVAVRKKNRRKKKYANQPELPIDPKGVF